MEKIDRQNHIPVYSAVEVRDDFNVLKAKKFHEQFSLIMEEYFVYLTHYDRSWHSKALYALNVHYLRRTGKHRLYI